MRLSEQSDNFFDTPYVIRNSCFHRWRHPQGLVDAADVVKHEVERNGGCVLFLNFLLKAFVNHVNRRIDIRMVRF
jgi:hypothetical protein